jgi:hypothetical protein
MTHPEKVVCPPDAFIRTTGQLWKLVVGGIVLPIPLALLAMRGLRQAPSESLSDFLLTIGVALGGAIAIVLVLASVACPRCRRRLLRDVFSAPDGAAAITAFLARRTCPSCGYDPSQAG